VVPEKTPDELVARIRRDLTRLASDEASLGAKVIVEKGARAVEVAAAHCKSSDLVILGVQRLGSRQRLFGGFTRQLAQAITSPLLVISHRR
jgi:nucleotide-binding universal stress UspA family protein